MWVPECVPMMPASLPTFPLTRGDMGIWERKHLLCTPRSTTSHCLSHSAALRTFNFVFFIPSLLHSLYFGFSVYEAPCTGCFLPSLSSYSREEAERTR